MIKKRKTKYSEGYEGVTTSGCKFTLIRKESHKECYIVFDNFSDYGEVLTNAKNIARGTIINPFKPSVYGKGYTGVLTNPCKEERSYRIWSGMLRRCYSGEISSRFWEDCSVDEDWLCYKNFREWYDKTSIYSKDTLDKDILIKGNRLYSKDTCCLVPNEINVLLTNRRNFRGEQCIGVQRRGSLYVARCSVRGDFIEIGKAGTEQEAFNIYKEFKESHIKTLAKEYLEKDLITLKVYNALYNYKISIED